jgi:hypothetical protein
MQSQDGAITLKIDGRNTTRVHRANSMLKNIAIVIKHERRGWSHLPAIPVAGIFLIVDLAFFSANLLKIVAGDGWVPLTRLNKEPELHLAEGDIHALRALRSATPKPQCHR